MLEHFIGHFVPFQDVRKRVDGVTHLLGYFHRAVDLTLHIGVTSNETFLFQDFDQGIQFQITARSHTGEPFFALRGIVSIPGLLIIFSSCEGIDQHLLHAHAGIGIAIVAQRR